MNNFIKKLFTKKKDKPQRILMMEDSPILLSELEKYMLQHKTYSYTALEGWRIDKFKTEHAQTKCGNKSKYALKFLNTSGIGTSVRCVCEVCGQECDVTDVSSW